MWLAATYIYYSEFDGDSARNDVWPSYLMARIDKVVINRMRRLIIDKVQRYLYITKLYYV